MVTFEDEQFLQKTDYESIEIAALNWGVIEGEANELEVTWTSGMNVQINTGSGFLDDKRFDITPAESKALTADGTHPRKALITLDNTGTINVTYGTAEAASPDPTKTGIYTPIPRPPSVPANSIPLAEVWIPAGASTLASSYVTDKRYMIVMYRNIETRTSDPTGDSLFNGRIWLRTDL